MKGAARDTIENAQQMANEATDEGRMMHAQVLATCAVAEAVIELAYMLETAVIHIYQRSQP